MSRSVPKQALLLALAIFVVDQALKYLVTVVLDLDRLAAVRTILPVFDLRFVANCGISLGLLGEYSDNFWVRIGLVAGTSAIAAGVLYWMWRESHPVDRLALGCVFGGALGNIADRAMPAGVLGKVSWGPIDYPGCVIDFADLHFGEWRPFLVFNLADAAITIGVLILLARALFTREKPRAPDAPVAENVNA